MHPRQGDGNRAGAGGAFAARRPEVSLLQGGRLPRTAEALIGASGKTTIGRCCARTLQIPEKKSPPVADINVKPES
jgi:hypothetical protein